MHGPSRLLAAAAAATCLAAEPESPALLRRAGVDDARVLQAFSKVRRAAFLPPAQRAFALEDRPLPIGYGQTTSQPTLIAQMLQALRLRPGCRALEVGTGSGFQTALLAELCADVYSLDILEPLATAAAARLRHLGYRNAHVRAGDGYLGWPEAAPFDAIVVCAAAPKVPAPLLAQLRPGGRLVLPLGEGDDAQLVAVTKAVDGTTAREPLSPVRFVPLVGPAAERDRREAADATPPRAP